MGFNRRTFLQMTAGGTVGILFTPVVWKLLDDVSIWTQNWPWIPKLTYGAPADVPAVSKVCNSGCAVKVRTVAGKAFGTEGNPDNVLSQGGICPMCANAVQLMYSPNRVKGPMKKVGEGKFEQISWDAAKEMLAAKLKAAGSKVAVISGDQTGSANEVFSGFLAGLGSDDFYMMPCDMQAASRAWNGVMKGEGSVGYDIANSDYVLLLGADALESWGPTVQNQKVFSASHPVGEDATAKYVYAGPMQAKTASVTDKWVPVPAEGFAAFTLGVAYHVLQAGKSFDAPDFPQFKSMVMSTYAPAKVEAATGVKADRMAQIAKELMSANAPVVVPAGTSVAAALAAFSLNLLLGRLNAEGGLVALPEMPKAIESAMSVAEMYAKDLPAAVAKGMTPAVLMVYEANPAYALPEMPKAGFTVSFATYMDETASAADLILPSAHSYERVDDLANPYGVGKSVYTASMPVAKADLDVLAGPDYVLAVAAELGVDLGAESFEAVVGAKAEALGSDLETLAEGAALEIDGYVEQVAVQLGASVLGRAAQAVRGTNTYALAAFNDMLIGTAKRATTPNAPCAVSVHQLVGDFMVVQMADVTAKKIGVGEGSKVKLSGGNSEITALVHINEGVMPGIVAAPLGLGHTVGDEFSKGKGGNVYKLVTVTSEAATGASVWAGSTVNVAKI